MQNNQPFRRAYAYMAQAQALAATGLNIAAIIAKLGEYQGGSSRRKAHATGSIMPNKRAAQKHRNTLRNRSAHKGR